MALDAPTKITKRKDLAFALETTTGTAVAVGAGQGVVPVFNPDMPYATESVERQPNGSNSAIRQGRGARPGSCSFETEMYGDESAAWIPLLQMCGLTLATDVLTPTSQPVQTGTIGLYLSGRLKKLVGCMGSAVISFRRGQAPRIRWSFTGKQGGLTDVAIITPTKVTTKAPRVGGVFTIGGSTYITDNLDLDLGNVVTLREDISDTDTGFRAAMITDRQPRIRIAPESLPLSTKDWQDFYHSSTTAALVLTVGVADNGWTLAAPKLELASDPSVGDRGGLMTDVLEFIPLSNSAGGDDEFSLAAL